MAGIEVEAYRGLQYGGHNWAQRYIRLGKQNNFFNTIFDQGISFNDAVYRAGTTRITREFAFYLLFRVFSLSGELEPQFWNRLRYSAPFPDSIPFVDYNNIYVHYRGFIMWLSRFRVVNGRNGGFLDPKHTITRAEVTAILFNMTTPFGSTFEQTRDLQPSIPSFDVLDPNGLTYTPRVIAYSQGSFNNHGAMQHNFTTPRTGLYVFGVNNGYDPVLFQVVREGFRYRFERLMPEWGSTNIFYLESGSVVIVEPTGMHQQNFILTIMQRGAYSASVHHYFDHGYVSLLAIFSDNADRARFEGLDAIADRIFFELVGMSVETGRVASAPFTSRMDACREGHIERYGVVLNHSHLCIPYRHTDDCVNASGVLICTETETYCATSCSNALEFAWNDIMLVTNPAYGNPGRAAIGNPVSTWIGSASFWDTRPNRSYNRSFVWGMEQGIWTNVFMFERNYNQVPGVYVHELAHIFGARDHYCERRYPEDGGAAYCINGLICSNLDCSPHLVGRNPRPALCIMNEHWEFSNVANMHAHDVFCVGCIDDIAAFLMREDIINYFRKED